MSYRIADLLLTVDQSLASDRPTSALPPAYAPFVSSAPAAESDVTVLAESGPPEQLAADPDGPRCETTQWIAYRSEDRPVFLFKSVLPGLPFWRSAVRERREARWRVRTAPEFRSLAGVDREPAALAFPLGELVFLDALTERGGLVFHSCGIRDGVDGGGRDGTASERRGMIFTGRSGRGKSTIGGLWTAQGATVLCDDRIAIRPTPTGHVLYGTPWHGDLRQVSPECGPLHALFFLEHAEQTLIERISPAEAQRRMLTTVWQPVWTGRAGLGVLWDGCARLAREVPMYRLRFRPEPATIDRLRGVMAALA